MVELGLFRDEKEDYNLIGLRVDLVFNLNKLLENIRNEDKAIFINDVTSAVKRHEYPESLVDLREWIGSPDTMLHARQPSPNLEDFREVFRFKDCKISLFIESNIGENLGLGDYGKKVIDHWKKFITDQELKNFTLYSTFKFNSQAVDKITIETSKTELDYIRQMENIDLGFKSFYVMIKNMILLSKTKDLLEYEKVSKRIVRV